MAIQMLKLLDTLRLEVMFSPVDFDFTGYYQQFHETEENAVRDNAVAKVQQMLKTPM